MGNLWKIYGHLWTSMKNLWKSMEIYDSTTGFWLCFGLHAGFFHALKPSKTHRVPVIFHREISQFPSPPWQPPKKVLRSQGTEEMGEGRKGWGRERREPREPGFLVREWLVGGLEHGFYFSISYMGCHHMSSFPLTNSYIFQDGFLTTNQMIS